MGNTILVLTIIVTLVSQSEAIHCDKELNYHENYGYGSDITCDGLTTEENSLLKDLTAYNEIVLKINNSNLTNVTSKLFYNVELIRYLFITNSTFKYRKKDAPFQNLKDLEHFTVENTVFNNFSDEFQRLSKLKQISLINNSLSVIKPKSFGSNLEVLRISRNGLLNLAPRDLPSLQRLLLDHNLIQNISKLDVANFSVLKELDLRFNRINLVESLGLIPKLRILNLEGNQLNDWGSDVFGVGSVLESLNLASNGIKSVIIQNLVKLKSLDLGNNSLTEIVLGGFPDLENLVLSRNRLGSFHFRSLPKLKVLLLDDNLIEDFDFGVLGFPDLEHLDLSGNPLNLNADMFVTLSNLKELVVRNAQLETLRFGLFSVLKNLEILDLSHNRIATIDNNRIFENLTNLVVLNISYNYLDHLDYEIFKKFELLQILDVSGNRLQNFDFNIISYLPSLREINIKANLISCRTLREIILFLEDKRISFSVSEEIEFDRQNIAGIYCEASLEKIQLVKTYPSMLTIFAILTCVLLSSLVVSTLCYKILLAFRRRRYSIDEFELLEE